MLDFTNYFIENTKELTEPQRVHLRKIINKTVERMIIKYVRGAIEHGGDLWDKECLGEAFDETIDQMTYIMTEIVKREKEVDRLADNL